MPAATYLEAVRQVLDHLERTQQPAVEQAADLVIHALRHSGAVFCSDIGHGNHQDFLNRACGLAAVQHFTSSFTVQDNVPEALRDRPRAEAVERDLEAVRLAVRSSNLRPGDVLLVGSVSGRNRAPIELALACRDAGVKVVAFTSMDYTARVESAHPSGKKLCDVADVVIDHGAPFGDAAVDVPGVAITVLPVSGVGAIVAGWMVWERVLARMAAEGDPPTVFMSVNREGGMDYYRKAVETYNRRGY